jgi:hypothetical protein
VLVESVTSGILSVCKGVDTVLLVADEMGSRQSVLKPGYFYIPDEGTTYRSCWISSPCKYLKVMTGNKEPIMNLKPFETHFHGEILTPRSTEYEGLT